MNKECCVCHEVKSITQYFQASMNRGPMGACKVCHTARNKAASITYKESRREARVAYNNRPDRKKANYENMKKMYKLYPEHQQARMKVYQAIKRGKLSKLPCRICGEVKAQAHHNDYSKPLEVVWLCIKHHKELHAKVLAS